MGLSQAGIDELLQGATALAGEAPAQVQAEPVVSAPLRAGARRHASEDDVRRILKLVIPITAVLAERDMTVKSVLDLAAGTILEFDVAFDSDLDLRVADHTIASGQAVKVGENFGIRISNIQSVRDRIDALGGE